MWFETLESLINQSDETQFSGTGGVHGHSANGVPEVARGCRPIPWGDAEPFPGPDPEPLPPSQSGLGT